MQNYPFYFPKGSTIQDIPAATLSGPHSLLTLNSYKYEQYLEC
jgi:hypothetical protein